MAELWRRPPRRRPWRLGNPTTLRGPTSRPALRSRRVQTWRKPTRCLREAPVEGPRHCGKSKFFPESSPCRFIGLIHGLFQNVDFSAEAVRLGQEAETEQVPEQAMKWERADLLAWEHVDGLAKFAPFDVIMDKSTSDAIATFDDRKFQTTDDSPAVCPSVRGFLFKQSAFTLSPVELLALNLVPLTRRDTTWIALSYSTLRFDDLPFLEKHWNLRSRTPLKAPSGAASSAAYTPEVFHWVYILDRK